MKKLIFVALGVVITLSAVTAVYVLYFKKSPQPINDKPIITETPAPIQNDKIIIEYPLPGTLVTSPLTVTGKARGLWYFEASFPVILQDSDGKILAQIPAQAQDDWMTENFVPFKGTLEFAAPETFTGVLIFKKDNPSGLPEYEEEVRVPVKFK